MADRSTLAVNKLEPFKQWLVDEGWDIDIPLTNDYEVLRAKNKQLKHTIIVYRKLFSNRGGETEHLSVREVDRRFVRAFLKGR